MTPSTVSRPQQDVSAGPGGAPPWASGAGTPPEAPPRRAFRPEIQGLRAFAVLLVACYHIWFGRVSGGVDVFVFVSAFLMTLSFTGKLERGERVGWKRISTYWVHVFKRILPLASLTVAGVLVGTRLLFTADRWPAIMDESVAAMLYYSNWWDIQNQVDYYASEASLLSPLRHFWSLSVQGQIFLVFPLVFAVAGMFSRRLRLPVRPVLLLFFGAIFVSSLTYSVIETAADQTSAYYSTFTRLWEFALGAMVAVVLPWIRLPGPVRATINWVGLILILICGAVLDVQGMFPGYVALWPTLAASMILIGGQSGTRWGADRILSSAPLVALGGSSYALYLLHWPLLVFYLNVSGVDHPDFFAGVGILGVALLGAWLMTRLVDTPLRTWSWAEARRWRSLLVVAGCLVLGLGTVWGWQAHIAKVTRDIEASADVNNPGAEILDPDYTYRGAEHPGLLPTAIDRTQDWAWERGMGTYCSDEETVEGSELQGEYCYHVVAPEHPTRTVVAVGNSHTEQWITALKKTAQDQDWDLTFVRQPGCFFTTVEDNAGVDYCQEWLPQAEAFIAQHHPDQLVIQSTFSSYDGTAENIRPGTEQQVRRWTGEGMRVVGIRDNARFTEAHLDCEQEHSDDQCVFPQVTAYTSDPTRDWEQRIPGYGAVDMDDLVCPDGGCPPAVGNVYTYIDDNHLTATYVSSMQKFFDQRFADADRISREAMAGAASGAASDQTSTAHGQEAQDQS